MLLGVIMIIVRKVYLFDVNDVYKNCIDFVGEEGGVKYVGYEFFIFFSIDYFGGYQSNGQSI